MCWFYCYLSIIWLAVSSLPELTASLTWYKLDWIAFCWTVGSLGKLLGIVWNHVGFLLRFRLFLCLKISCLRKTAKNKKCLDWIRYFDFACFFSPYATCLAQLHLLIFQDVSEHKGCKNVQKFICQILFTLFKNQLPSSLSWQTASLSRPALNQW